MDHTLIRTRPKSRSFRVSTAALIIGSVCLALITVVTPDAILVTLLTMLMLFVLPLAMAIDFLVAAADRRSSGVQFSLRQLLLVITCIAVYASLLREPWTFRLRFAISRPALERPASKVEHGACPGPQWAGLFFIQKASREERDDEYVTVLWTEPGGGSPSGFIHPRPKHDGVPWLFNDYSTALQSDPEWFHFIQD